MYQETEMEREHQRRKSVRELSDLIVSNITYRNYLESLGEDNNLSIFCNVDKLKVMYASFMMILWKDEFALKSKRGMIHPKLLSDLISFVASEDENRKWCIGEIKFEDENSVIDFLRNKMAHGDFLIEKDKVNFSIDGKSGSVEIDDLVDFTNALVTKMEKMQVKGKNTNIYMNVALPRKLKVKRMKTIEDIKKRLYYLKYIEINDQPYPGKTRSLDYIQMVDEFVDCIINNKKELTIKEYEKIVGYFYKKFIDTNVDIRVTSTRAGQLPDMENFAKKMLKNKFFREEKDPEKQLHLLAYAVYEKNDPTALKKSLTEGLIMNQNILYEIGMDPNAKLKDIMKENHKMPLPEKFKIQQAVVAAQMVAFYIVYIYGFDRIYNADERDHLDKIFDGSMFDFSKLDLSFLESDIPMSIKDYPYFLEQLEKNRKDKTELMDRFFEMDNSRDGLENRIEEMKEEKKEIPENMIQALESQKKRLIETNQKYQNLKRKIDYEHCFMEFNFEDYKKNRSKIEHMRNSITHGNIKVKYMDDSEKHNETIFCFKDMEEGHETFSAKLTQNEFNQLIAGRNLHAISTFLDENIKQYNRETANNTIISKQHFLKRGKV